MIKLLASSKEANEKQMELDDVTNSMIIALFYATGVIATAASYFQCCWSMVKAFLTNTIPEL
jgi:hypothetical protein